MLGRIIAVEFALHSRHIQEVVEEHLDDVVEIELDPEDEFQVEMEGLTPTVTKRVEVTKTLTWEEIEAAYRLNYLGNLYVGDVERPELCSLDKRQVAGEEFLHLIYTREDAVLGAMATEPINEDMQRQLNRHMDFAQKIRFTMGGLSNPPTALELDHLKRAIDEALLDLEDPERPF